MSLVQTYLAQRRKRLVSRLMRYMETEVYPTLSPAQRVDLRKAVIDAADEYHGSAVDLVKAAVDDTSVLNDEAMRAIARVDSYLTGERRRHA